MSFLSFVLLLVSFNSFASNPCGGSPVGFWTNPDGSRGGWVAKTSSVQAGAIIAPEAEVCDSAQVKSGAQVLGQAHIGGRAQILKGAVIDGRAKVQGEAKVGGSGAVTKVGGDATVEGSSTITGTSNVFARAKVDGGARVHNSIICQASVIEGTRVENSDYYCQTEDPEPPHPGEAGMKTLLGVDSDNDEVRDDVEIWINDTYSNTDKRDNSISRVYQKEMAIVWNKILLHSNNRMKAKEALSAKDNIVDCGLVIFSDSDGLSRYKDLKAKFLNTETRLSAYLKSQKYEESNGIEQIGTNKHVCDKFQKIKKLMK